MTHKKNENVWTKRHSRPNQKGRIRSADDRAKRAPFIAHTAFMLTVVLLLSLCLGCSENSGTGANKATVIDNEGNSVQLSEQEIIDVYDNNEAKFNHLYKGAKITFTGKVTSIRASFWESGVPYELDQIDFEEGWRVYLLHGHQTSVLEKLDAGVTIKVESTIYSAFGSAFGGTVDIRGAEYYGTYFIYNEETLKRTKITVLN